MTDERDPKVSQRYRELGREEPPGELDAGILAASRRAVETHLAPLVPPTGRRRWYFPVAAAAIITLAVAVTVQVERQQPDAESITPPPPSTPESRADALEAKKDSAPQAELRKAKRAEPPAALAPAPAARLEQSPQSPQNAQAKPESRARSTESVQAPAARRDAESGTPARLLGQVAKAESPEAALERIAELRRQGKQDEADKALAEFRRRYPDYRIAEEMLKKVERP
jgi:hypothetical protein